MASVQQSSFVQGELSRLLHAVEESFPDGDIFGSLEDGKLRLPVRDDDGRKLTWTKLFNNIASKVINVPTSVNDCWFVPATKDDGYHEIKLSKDGSKNKYRTHRVLRVFVDPDCYLMAQDRTEDHAMHLCGRGKGSAQESPCCINPYHVRFGSSAANQDAKGCKYGAAFLCPHTDNPCIWVSPVTGRFKPCRSNRLMTTCTCGQDCFLVE